MDGDGMPEFCLDKEVKTPIRKPSLIDAIVRRLSKKASASRIENIYGGNSDEDAEGNDDGGNDDDDDAAPIASRNLSIPRRPRGGTVATSHQQLEEKTNSLFLILSSMYGIFLVVLGSVIPLTQSFVGPDHPYAFEVFYVYLHVVSILFLVYVYAYLLRRNNLRGRFVSRTLATPIAWTKTVATAFTWRSSVTSTDQNKKKRRISVDVSPHTGSFYLRLGAIGFGIGSMIHSGLHFGQFLAFDDGLVNCADILQVIKPFLHLIFIFTQLYFIFLNSKMCIHRHKILGRFGLMHMCANNICVWFRIIVVETLHVIHAHEAREGHDSNDTHAADVDVYHVQGNPPLHGNTTTAHGLDVHAVAAPGERPYECKMNPIISQLVTSSGPYLYPCTIEYSLMSAGILYVMWKNVGRHPRRYQSDSDTDDDDEEVPELSNQRMSVDCAGSSRGLFIGILLAVGAIISIIAFYVMTTDESIQMSALVLTFISETSIYVLTTVALVIAAFKMKNLHFRSNHMGDLEDTLILISHTGLLCFAVFSLVAAILQPFDERSTLTIVSNVMMVVQATVQTVFILAGERMSAASPIQVRKKPGREFVTFLLLCNFAMWAMSTFQTQKPEHNPIQVEFYGPNAWAIFTHISVPLGIFYRFHSSVCFSNIWKNAWKIRKHY